MGEIKIVCETTKERVIQQKRKLVIFMFLEGYKYSQRRRSEGGSE